MRALLGLVLIKCISQISDRPKLPSIQTDARGAIIARRDNLPFHMPAGGCWGEWDARALYN